MNRMIERKGKREAVREGSEWTLEAVSCILGGWHSILCVWGDYDGFQVAGDLL